MDPILLTVIITAIIAIGFIAVVVKGIINAKSGKHCGSCGGACAACPAKCSCKDTGATQNNDLK
jgi:ABC-type xylose transport system permease subunit